MTSILSRPQAQKGQNSNFIPVGFDCGAGLIKTCFGGNGSQTRVRMPSKVLELTSPLLEELVSRKGAYFFYQEGSRQDLTGREFLVGDLAAWKAPNTHIKLSDDSSLKAVFALHCILSAASAANFAGQEINLFVVVSTHNCGLFNAQLKELTSGTHIVRFGSRNNTPTRVNISIGLVVPEGAGSYAHARQQGLLEPLAHVIALDIGTSTVIPQVFAPGGKLIYHQPLEAGGCIDLLDSIASSPELIQALGTGKSGNIELVRNAIETDFIYGSRGFDLREVYSRSVTTWLGDRLRLAFRATDEWRDSCQSFVAWGGGSEMPGIAGSLKTQRITTIPAGGWANAIGLQIIAAGLLARRN